MIVQGSEQNRDKKRMSNEARHSIVWEKADTFKKRLVGLLGRRYLAAQEGMYFPNCRSVHTWFMRIPITVLFCDRQGKIIKMIPCLRPWSWAFCVEADFVVELRAYPPFSFNYLQSLVQQNCISS